MSLYIIKKQGTEVHCIPPEVPKLEPYSSNVDALARIGCDVVLFIPFNISAIGVVPIAVLE